MTTDQKKKGLGNDEIWTWPLLPEAEFTLAVSRENIFGGTPATADSPDSPAVLGQLRLGSEFQGFDRRWWSWGGNSGIHRAPLIWDTFCQICISWHSTKRVQLLVSTALLKQFSGRWRRHTAHFGPSTAQREGWQRWQLTSMSRWKSESDLILLTAFTMVSVGLPRSEPELEKSRVSPSEKGMLCLLFHGLCTYPKSKYRSLPKGVKRSGL